MKLGLITTHYAVNYGAVLQAYALRKAIENLGYDCEVINFTPAQKVNGRNICYKFNSIKEFLNSIYVFLNLFYRRKLSSKNRMFDQFLKEFFVISKERYFSYSELHDRMPKYDCLVCGSDQIWNLNLFSEPAYFLRFEDVYPEIGYIAYAPSITEKLSDLQYAKLAENIAHFSAISVREKEGAKVLGKFIDKPVENVLDPVFLLDKADWEEIAEPMDINEPYILLYSVAGDKNYPDVVEKIRKKLNYKVVCINNASYNKFNADECIYDASPENFIWLIKNAKFICTSSFHAVAFSVIFEKQFYSVPLKGRSSRQESLLDQLELNDRILYDLSALDNNALQAIDYSIPNQRLKELKTESLNFLESAINNVKMGR